MVSNGDLNTIDTAPVQKGARRALTLLLAINLFNYIDRYILAAVEPNIRDHFFTPDDPDAMAKTGSLATAFLVSYMIASPVFGWLADRMPRWKLIGVSVIFWSIASAGSGLAMTFGLLILTRLFVGIGEAGYGPSAPTIISDLFSEKKRGKVLSFFYMAIPVGSALGFFLGGQISGIWNWRYPFFVLAVPGVVLGVLCFFLREPPRGGADGQTPPKHHATMADYLGIFRTPSYVLNTAAMIAMTFAIGGISFWVPAYVHDFRGVPDLAAVNMKFGAITAVAGLTATLLGGLTADWVRSKLGGAYFLVSGAGMLVAFPLTVLMLRTPFPNAWYVMFFAVFFLFFNTGPSNAAIVNVTHPTVRATAFALNIFLIHALGDAISPPLIGAIADRWNLNVAFMVVASMMLLASIFWFIGVPFLERDTARALSRRR